MPRNFTPYDMEVLNGSQFEDCHSLR